MTDEQRLCIAGASKAVGEMLEALALASTFASEDIPAEKRDEYVKTTCALVALTVATMPCVRVAMAIARPEMDARDRYALVCYQIIKAFGFDIELGAASEFVRPFEPSLN